MGSGSGLVVMVSDSGLLGRGFDPHTGHASLLNHWYPDHDGDKTAARVP